MSLRQHGHEPPVVFYVEYVDMWSMGSMFTWFIETPPCQEMIEVCADQMDLLCYALPDDGALANTIRRLMRRKRIRQSNPQEERWYLLFLSEALAAWETLVQPGAIIVLRELLGATTEDSEIENSLARIPEWLGGRPSDRPAAPGGPCPSGTVASAQSAATRGRVGSRGHATIRLDPRDP